MCVRALPAHTPPSSSQDKAPFQHKLDELIAMLQAREALPHAEPKQQRKLVTMLFKDITSSTAIAKTHIQ